MAQDVGWKGFLSDDERYADIINGLACGGMQVVRGSDLLEKDTQIGLFSGRNTFQKLTAGKKRQKIKLRDMVRKVAFGTNFAIIGIENQECIDYSLPLRNLAYDVGEYESQASRIRKLVRKEKKGLSKGEYLYGFRKDSMLNPVVTLILYFGAEEWDGPRSLHEMLDFTNIPKHIVECIPDYKINVIEIRNIRDTSIFMTDVRQVFDFIRCAGDKEALKELIEKDSAYQSMEEDAFDVMVQYAKAEELIGKKSYYERGGKVNMCKAITDWLAEERETGIQTGIQTSVQLILKTRWNVTDELCDELSQHIYQNHSMEDSLIVLATKADSLKEFCDTVGFEIE